MAVADSCFELAVPVSCGSFPPVCTTDMFICASNSVHVFKIDYKKLQM